MDCVHTTSDALYVVQSVTRLVHFMYTGELVAGPAQLPELRSLAQALGTESLLTHLDKLEHQIAAASLHKTLFSTPAAQLQR